MASYLISLRGTSWLLLLLVFSSAASSASAADLPLRLITYNIRYATASPSAGEQPWAVRRPRLSAQLNFLMAGQPDALVCLQEVLSAQLANIQADMGPAGWTHLGVGRDDGRAAGEFSPILYRRSSWAAVQNRTYWLSPDPDAVGSRGWDAALPRIATAAVFRHAATGREAALLCTHFDNAGSAARENSARLLVRLADEWSAIGQQQSDPRPRPVFVAGDLNSDTGGAAYRVMTAPSSPYSSLRDARELVPTGRRHGNEKTFTGFTASTGDDTRLDYIFARDPTGSGLRFESYAVMPNKFEDDAVYISDHRPVVVDLILPS